MALDELSPAGPEPELQPTEQKSFAEAVADAALSFLSPPDSQVRTALIEQIVAGAVTLIPGTSAAAVEQLNRQGRLEAPLAAGDEVARAMMQAQNDTGQGPCLDASRDGKQVLTGDLTLDQRWPLFAARVSALGIRAVICTPMEAAGRTVGVLSLMSRTTHFLQDEHESGVLATVFAAHAAIALTGARQLQDSSAALANRDVIGQAKGILMERFKLAPDAAFATLVRISSDNNIKLRLLCEELCRTGTLPPVTRRRS